MTKQEKENRNKGIIAAIVVHSLLIIPALFFVSCWETSGPPYEWEVDGIVPMMEISNETGGKAETALPPETPAAASSAASETSEEEVEETEEPTTNTSEELPTTESENPITQPNTETNTTTEQNNTESPKPTTTSETVTNTGDATTGESTSEAETNAETDGESEEESESTDSRLNDITRNNQTAGGGGGNDKAEEFSIPGWSHSGKASYKIQFNCDLRIDFKLDKTGNIVTYEFGETNCPVSDEELEAVIEDIKRNKKFIPKSTSRVTGLSPGSVIFHYQGK